MEKSLLKLEREEVILSDDCLDEEFQGVEFELISPNEISDENRARIKQGLSEVEERLAVVNNKVAELNSEIDRLTNHADGLDYTIAVASGILTGLIDSFFVGELGLFNNASDEAKEKLETQKARAMKSLINLSKSMLKPEQA